MTLPISEIAKASSAMLAVKAEKLARVVAGMCDPDVTEMELILFLKQAVAILEDDAELKATRYILAIRERRFGNPRGPLPGEEHANG